MRTRMMTFACGVLLVLCSLPFVAAQAQSDQRCFSETNQCISGPIRQFWERNGGLAVFGLPISPQQQEQIEGRPINVQWFERNRLELHPEAAAPYDVQLGRIGVELLAQRGRDWQGFAKTAPQPNCRFFAETGHNVCAPFLALWRANGLELDGKKGKSEAENLALLGLPLSDAQNESLADGGSRTVQWFERGRVELHPEHQPPYDVQLGLLGSEALRGRDSVPVAPARPTTEPAASTATLAPTAAPAPTATPAPVRPSATPQRRANCDAAYPTVCIPPPPPDLDCGDIPFRNFVVRAPDPHRFDRDHDGIGCES